MLPPPGIPVAERTAWTRLTVLLEYVRHQESEDATTDDQTTTKTTTKEREVRDGAGGRRGNHVRRAFAMKTNLQEVRLTRILRACTGVALLSILFFGLVYAPPSPRGTDLRPQRGGDLELYSSIVARLQAGTPYYVALGSELRARGYPTTPVMNWRTPLHLSTVAALRIPLARLVFGILGLMVLVAGIWALAPRGSDAKAWGTFCLAGAAIPVVLVDGSVLFSEAWCGLLIGLSLAFYARQRWLVAAGCGVLAVFVRELAAPYVLVCGLAALVARRQKESLVWLLGGVAYVIYYAIHASSARAAMEPGALAHIDGWIRWQGLAFVFSTAKWYAWASLAPRVLSPLVVTGGLAATAAPAAPVQLRLGILAYVATFAIIGQPFNVYWGWVTAPLWAFGLAYSVDGLRWIVNVPRADSGRTDARATVGGRLRATVGRLMSPRAVKPTPRRAELNRVSPTMLAVTGDEPQAS